MGFVKILESLAVIAAALTAIYGISSWRREMRGRKEYELSEEVLSLFYEARDKISAIRSPLVWSGEGKSRQASPEESPEQKEAFDQAHIVNERYQFYQETFNKLRTLRYRFMALFGQDKAKPFDDLNKIVSKIHAAARILGNYWARLNKMHLPWDEKKYDNLYKQIEKSQSVIWEGNKPDPIAQKVEKLIEEIEKICEPILRKELSWFSKIFKKRSQ